MFHNAKLNHKAAKTDIFAHLRTEKFANECMGLGVCYGTFFTPQCEQAPVKLKDDAPSYSNFSIIR